MDKTGRWIRRGEMDKTGGELYTKKNPYFMFFTLQRSSLEKGVRNGPFRRFERYLCKTFCASLIETGTYP